MPGEHRDMYVSTTLSLVIFTTVVCGGLTAPMMSKMGMRQLPVNLTNPLSPGASIECHYEVNNYYVTLSALHRLLSISTKEICVDENNTDDDFFLLLTSTSTPRNLSPTIVLLSVQGLE